MQLKAPPSDIYEAVVACQTEGTPAALAIIVAAFGSTPQKTGAKMLVKGDGSTVGTVGGGQVEAQVIQTALKVLQSGTPPTFQDRRGHPTLFPKALLAEIYQGFNLREIIGRHPDKVTLLPVEDEGVVLDMDTPEDYREICRRLEEETHDQ